MAGNRGAARGRQHGVAGWKDYRSVTDLMLKTYRSLPGSDMPSLRQMLLTE
jgi:hypothetical protein